MDFKREIRVMVLTKGNLEQAMLESLTFETKVHFESALNPNECLVRLQSNKYDALIVDTDSLMSDGRLNTYFTRAVCDLAPVIVLSDNEQAATEDAIRAEKIFYYMVRPVSSVELKTAVLEASRWNLLEKQKEAARHERKLIHDVPRFLKTCMILLLFAGAVCGAQEITVSVSAFRNLTGNECNDWIGAGFASNLTTTVQNIPGIEVIEEAEMGKLLESIKFGLSGFVDEKTVIEKGRVIGARYTVVGSVQLFSDKAVVCYRLVNMETGQVVFSNTAKGKLKNILGLEEEVSRDIVKHFENKFPSTCLRYDSKKKSNFAIIHGDGAQGLKYSPMVDLDAAAKCYEEAISDNPEYADGYLGLGEIYMQKKEYTHAVTRFLKACDLYEEYKDGYFSGCASYKIGEAYYQLSDYDSALSYFEKALQYKKHAKNDFQVLYIYGRLSEIAELRAEYAKSSDYMKKAVKLSKKLGDDKTWLEYLARLAGNFEPASGAKIEEEPAATTAKLAPALEPVTGVQSAQVSAAQAEKLAGRTEKMNGYEKGNIAKLQSRLQKKMTSAGKPESL